MVKQVTSAAEFKSALQAEGLTVVDFTATWCGPCKMISPFVDQLATEYPSVHFLKVDVDELEDVAAENNITAMPTFLFFRNGAKVHEFRGANKQALVDGVKKFM